MTDDPPDFDTWVSHRGAGLLRFAYLITRDRGRAEEAVQDALIAAYPRWSRSRGSSQPSPTIRETAVRTAGAEMPREPSRPTQAEIGAQPPRSRRWSP